MFISHYDSCLCTALYNDTITKLEINKNLSLSLDVVATRLKKEITATTNEELGIALIKKVYNKFKYAPVLQDVERNLKRITDKLELKINESFTLLNKTCKFIEELYYKGDNNRSKHIKSAIKQFYFLSNQDVTTIADTSISACKCQDHSLFWDVYVSRVITVPRNIMILLDHGGSLSKQQFKTVKMIAKSIISYLREEDRIGLLALADDFSSPYKTEQCLMPNQAPPVGDPYVISLATKHNKNLLIHFVNSLSKGSGITNHSLGFQQALQTINASNIPNNETVMLIYISRGLLSVLTEAKTVLKTISEHLSIVNNSIIINTCAVIDETKSVLYEMHFLGDIAKNYSKYSTGITKPMLEGIMLPVNSTRNVGLSVARFFKTLNPDSITYKPQPMLSLPRWDDVSKDITVAATVACGNNSEIGVLGLDLHFLNFIEDVTYYSNYQHYTYAFVIDSKGITIMHPSYPRPNVIKKQPQFVDIQYLENVPDIEKLRSLLLTEEKGNFTVRISNRNVHYVWQKVLNWYTVCIVVHGLEEVPLRPYKVSWHPGAPGIDLVHYRLDIYSSTQLCKHLNQLATLDAGTLYLSSSCFQSPYTYAQTTNTLSSLTIQSYMAYLKDNTRLLANPGLREEVRDDVAAMAHVLEYLRDQHLQGVKSKYIVRRYLASRNGVVQMFPGVLLPPDLEPTKRNWYLKSTEHKHKTILTPPYLDAGGAGYIVTLAHSTSHLVSAMDVTFGYIYKLILQHMPFCKESNVKCFMMDDRGYLIYHPNLIDPNGHGPMEQQHIIHKESLVANDILGHKHFVKKVLCNDYLDDTIQRYYRLNTSFDGVLGNTVHGEHGVRYQVSPVKDTNVFIGVVNASCEVVATFCPCSVVDRLCLNCNRMEQRECECPCECPLNLDTCTHPNSSYIDNSACPAVAEQQGVPVENTIANVLSELEPCLPISCESQSTHEDCLGVLGCEWCRIDVDGDSLLANPFCTSIQTCFNGVLGSPTPYSDQTDSASNSEDLLGRTYSPIGPVIGSIFGVCLGLVFLFFCYRSYTSPSIERFYLTSAHENRVRMSDVNVSDDYRDVDNHQDKLLQDSKKLEPVSPYCVSTGYRRPPTVADSDHGYSTMTPHDESEHLSFAPPELDSLEDDISDATSINTSVSSKQPQLKTQRTKLQELLPDTHLINKYGNDLKVLLIDLTGSIN
ncbi:hypothetical protein Trydic_g13334 [Trypoxylus dichotomus]